MNVIRLLWICFLLEIVGLYSSEFQSPQDQIIVLDQFISQEEAKALIRFYKKEKKSLQTDNDNQISISSISDENIRNLLFEISDRILEVMEQCYPIEGKKYHLDHGGLYARIKGNFCPYHADNLYFECPIHGKDQSILRKTCNGDCPGSKYVPNHTYWREYTGLLYLNEDFKGGEILFEDGPHNQFYQMVIPIRAKRLVLAPNGSHFYHEVFPIRKGTRYSVHFWYTSDPRHRLRS